MYNEGCPPWLVEMQISLNSGWILRTVILLLSSDSLSCLLQFHWCICKDLSANLGALYLCIFLLPCPINSHHFSPQLWSQFPERIETSVKVLDSGWFPPVPGLDTLLANWDNQKIISLISHLSEIIILYSLMSNAGKLAQDDNSYNSWSFMDQSRISP